MLNSVQKSIDDLKANFEYDKLDPNLKNRQESLRSKVKESDVTLNRTKNVSKVI
jgi:hypothetical protein